MNARSASWLAWFLAGLSFAICAANIALYILTRDAQVPSGWGTGGESGVFIYLLPFLAFPVVGALIASKRAGNPIGWICLAIGIFFMLNNATTTYGVYGLVARPGSVPFPAEIGSLGEWLWVPALGLLGTYLTILFPDGRLPSRGWRPVAWLSGAAIVVGSFGIALAPGPISDLGGVRNPFGLDGYPAAVDAMQDVLLLLLLCILASAASLILRFRRSGGEVREQIKWIAFAASLVGLVTLPILMIGTFIGWDNLPSTQPLWLQLFEDAVQLSYAGVPVAVGFAVLRYRLYDIEVVINRALVYGALTAILLLVYFGSIVLLQSLFRTLTGQESQLAVVASTLAIAALFNPLRRRIQALIDRRFYRRKYDAEKTLQAFNAKLRDEVELDTLSEDLIAVVRETVQPAHASLWLRPTGKRGNGERDEEFP